MRTDILERKTEIIQWISEGKPKNWIANQLHCKFDTLESYLKKMNIEYHGQPGCHHPDYIDHRYIPALEYIKTGTVKSPVLREKLLRENLKENKCARCGISTWLGQPLMLELHHIDGNHYNNDLDNLEILCPNCHSLTETYGRKNTAYNKE